MRRSLASLVLIFIFNFALHAAQSPDSAPPSAPQAAPKTDTVAPAKKKLKKIWTNDEMPSSASGISVVGGDSAPSAAAQPPKTSAPASTARERQLAALRHQLVQLQAQLAATDKQIAAVRNAQSGNTTGSAALNPRLYYANDSDEAQLKQLEDKKKQLHARIDDLEEAARKAGINPGDLR